MMMFGGLLLRLGCGWCAVIALVPSVVGLVAAFVAYVTAGCLSVCWLLLLDTVLPNLLPPRLKSIIEGMRFKLRSSKRNLQLQPSAVPPDLPQHWDPMPEGIPMQEIVIFDASDVVTHPIVPSAALLEWSQLLQHGITGGNAEAAMDLASGDPNAALQLCKETAHRGGPAKCAFSLWLHRLQGDNIERAAAIEALLHFRGRGRAAHQYAIVHHRRHHQVPHRDMTAEASAVVHLFLTSSNSGGRSDEEMPIKVIKVSRIQNQVVYRRFSQSCLGGGIDNNWGGEYGAPPAFPVMFHGTSTSAASQISKEGFRISCGRSANQTWFATDAYLSLTYCYDKQAQLCSEGAEEDGQYSILVAYVSPSEGNKALATGSTYAATCDSQSCPAYKIIFRNGRA